MDVKLPLAEDRRHETSDCHRRAPKPRGRLRAERKEWAPDVDVRLPWILLGQARGDYCSHEPTRARGSWRCPNPLRLSRHTARANDVTGKTHNKPPASVILTHDSSMPILAATSATGAAAARCVLVQIGIEVIKHSRSGSHGLERTAVGAGAII